MLPSSWTPASSATRTAPSSMPTNVPRVRITESVTETASFVSSQRDALVQASLQTTSMGSPTLRALRALLIARASTMPLQAPLLGCSRLPTICRPLQCSRLGVRQAQRAALLRESLLCLSCYCHQQHALGREEVRFHYPAFLVSNLI